MHNIIIEQCSEFRRCTKTLPPLRFEKALKVNVHSDWDVNMIELNDVPEVLEVERKVRVEKLELEDIGHPVAKESHSEARDLHCHSEHVQHPHACGPHGHYPAQCDRRVGQ